MRWEPLAAMAVLLALAVWLVVGGDDDGGGAVQVRIGQVRGSLEVVEGPPVAFVLRMPGAPPSRLDGAEFERVFGRAVTDAVAGEGRNWLFRLLNITSAASLVWIAVGFLGQAAFLGRMFVQWLVSERRRQSIVPESFWWLSLGGAVLLFSYFVWRRDVVGVIGQTTGVVVYARNLWLIHHRHSGGPDPALPSGA